MELSYNTHAPKKHVNLTANTELIDLVFEQSMIEFITKRELERWKEESKASFDSYNRMIEERGTLADDIGQQL